MSDKELCEAFGTTIDEVESDVDAFENGTWEGFKFGNPVDGKPEAVCIGAGWVDYPGFLAALKNDNYTGYMCLETHYRHAAKLDEALMNLPGGSAFSEGAAAASAEIMAAFRELLK
jgi:sugar phosphate isomerase/epimerase